jgi:hypothetical protein
MNITANLQLALTGSQFRSQVLLASRVAPFIRNGSLGSGHFNGRNTLIEPDEISSRREITSTRDGISPQVTPVLLYNQPAIEPRPRPQIPHSRAKGPQLVS